jgi:hypothetical protein
MGDSGMSNAGHKIIQGLKEAAAGNYARVHLFDEAGVRQAWVRETPLHRAAPDLLEALKMQMEVSIVLMRRAGFDDHDIQDCTGQARAAISKAEGKTE